MKHMNLSSIHLIKKMEKHDIAFLFLFASELAFYLLILQTGIVKYHHSIMAEIWMVPVGGMLGIVASVFLREVHHWLTPFLLFLQLLLVLNYTHASHIALFILGLIAGLTAPILIARIEHFWIAVLALALSYTYGTYYFSIPAFQRTDIAIFLSAIALLSSLFSQMKQINKDTECITYYRVINIFFWLLLDAALFETLSRDNMMYIWGNDTYTANIILFHLIGLMVAYKKRNWKYNNQLMVVLFILAYTFYSSGWQEGLSIVYPFVISYYNVIILKSLMRLPYLILASIAMSFWIASGLGLLVALDGSFIPAWTILAALIVLQICEKVQIPFIKTLKNCFSRILNLKVGNLE